MKFQYCIELKDGYKPTMQGEKENDLRIIVEAQNRATADRMIKAMLSGCNNIVSWSGICID